MMMQAPVYSSFQSLGETMTVIPCEVPGAVKIGIIKQGSGDLVPENSLVILHYAAYWEHEKKPFNSTAKFSRKAKFHKVVLREGLCLKGLQLAITSVRGPNARFLALLKPEVLWGVENLPPRIRPEPALFVIVLFAVKELQNHNIFFYLPEEEQGKYATVATTVQYLKDKAKDFFQTQRYRRAAAAYDRALDVLSRLRPENDHEKEAMKDLGVHLVINAAACFYMMDEPESVLEVIESSYENIDIRNHSKALFYKGWAYEQLQLNEKALAVHKSALNLEPDDKKICTAVNNLTAKIKRFKDMEAKMWLNAFHQLQTETYKEKMEEPKTSPIVEETVRKFFVPGALVNYPVSQCVGSLWSRDPRSVVYSGSPDHVVQMKVDMAKEAGYDLD